MDTDAIIPFRSQKTEFVWTQDLEEAFYKAKVNIVEKVKEEIAAYDMNHITVLNTDWSKVGVSRVVLQKYCKGAKIDLYSS